MSVFSDGRPSSFALAPVAMRLQPSETWSVALAGVGGRWPLFLWFALGAFAIGRLWIGEARIRRLRIDELEVGRITHVGDAD